MAQAAQLQVSIRTRVFWVVLIVAVLGISSPSATTQEYCSVTRPEVCGSHIIEHSYGAVIYDTQAGMAQSIAARVQDKWSWYVSWFAPIAAEAPAGGSHPPFGSPIKIFITDDATLALEDLGAIGVSFSGTSEIFISTNSDTWRPDILGYRNFLSTLYHELWHSFQENAGALDVYGPPDARVVTESTAVLASTILGEVENDALGHEVGLYKSQGFRRGLLDDSNRYDSSLFLHWMWQQYGDNSIRELISSLGSTQSDREALKTVIADGDFREFAKQLYNDGEYHFEVNGRRLTDVLGQNLKIDESSLLVLRCGESPVGRSNVSPPEPLPPLSVRRYKVSVNSNAKHCNIYLNDFKKHETGFAYLFLKDTNDTIKFIDVTDESFVHLCFEADGVCADDSYRGFLDVQLIVGNDSLDTAIEIELAAGNLAKIYEFRQAAIFSNEDDLRTSVVGGHTLEFYENNVVILRGRPWWIVLPSRLFTQVDSDPEYAQALTWINDRCRMRGYARFRSEIVKAKMNDDGDEEITLKLTLGDMGGFADSPEGWFCDFSREYALSGVFGGAAAQAAVARVMTDLNATDYSLDTVIGRMGQTMRHFMTLGLLEGQSREITITHRKALTSNRMVIELPLTDTLIGYFLEAVK